MDERLTTPSDRWRCSWMQDGTRCNLPALFGSRCFYHTDEKQALLRTRP